MIKKKWPAITKEEMRSILRLAEANIEDLLSTPESDAEAARLVRRKLIELRDRIKEMGI